MEQLFDLLIDNPFILIAVIAFFVSMFKGKKAVPGMPTFGGGPDQDANDSPAQFPQEMQENRRKHHEVDDRHDDIYELPTIASGAPADFHSELYTEHKTRIPHLEDGNSVWDDSSLKSHSSLAEQEIGGTDEAGKQITAAEARQGVIWAEILGPPRAKRPLHK